MEGGVQKKLAEKKIPKSLPFLEIELKQSSSHIGARNPEMLCHKLHSLILSFVWIFFDSVYSYTFNSFLSEKWLIFQQTIIRFVI